MGIKKALKKKRGLIREHDGLQLGQGRILHQQVVRLHELPQLHPIQRPAAVIVRRLKELFEDREEGRGPLGNRTGYLRAGIEQKCRRDCTEIERGWRGGCLPRGSPPFC